MPLTEETQRKWRNRTAAIGVLVTTVLNVLMFFEIWNVDGDGAAAVNLIAAGATVGTRQLFTLFTGEVSRTSLTVYRRTVTGETPRPIVQKSSVE
jgi:hypothetical protein